MNSVGYSVGVLEMDSPSYMYAAVADMILAWYLHVNGMYMYYSAMCQCGMHMFLQMLHSGSTCSASHHSQPHQSKLGV